MRHVGTKLATLLAETLDWAAIDTGHKTMATTRRTFLQVAAGLGFAPWPAHAQALTKVRYVSSSPVARPYHAYMYAGARAGLHGKIGVDPEFLFIAGSGAVLQLLISGDGDIGN